MYKKMLCITLIMLSSLQALPSIQTREDLYRAFPTSVEAIQKKAKRAKIRFEAELKEIDQAIQSKKNSTEILKKIDLAFGNLEADRETFLSVMEVHTSPQVREKAAQERQNLVALETKALLSHPEYFDAVSSIDPTSLTSKAKLYRKQLLNDFKQLGLHLNEQQRETFQALYVKDQNIQSLFRSAIAKNQKKIVVDREMLQGMSSQFINSLSKDSNDHLFLDCSYPVFFPIMQQCTNQEVRKKLASLFSHRGYPENEANFAKMAQVRREIAKVMGYESFTDYQLDFEMIQKREKAEKFLFTMLNAAKPKLSQEISNLKMQLPKGDFVNELGQIRFHDFAYLKTKSEEKSFNISNDQIKEFFPFYPTLEKTLHFFGNLFGVSFFLEKFPMEYEEEMYLISTIEPSTGKALGYILLDCFPREGKYGHACMCPMVPSYKDSMGNQHPAFTQLIMNFPRPAKDSPSLLSLDDLRTFVHELGHALHEVFGCQEFIGQAGTRTSVDFVELPSQLMEEWLNEPSVLKSLSTHYLTQEAMPDALIDAILAKRNNFSGYWLTRQCILSLASLELFHNFQGDNPEHVFHQLCFEYTPDIEVNRDSKSYASFVHLTEYGARYYGYLWTRCMAADVFDALKAKGLYAPSTGLELRKILYSSGSSQEPEQILENLLGRQPKTEALIRRLELK